jgi:hypothetical protein
LCPNHFLDTSILLGSRIHWDDQFSHVSTYIGIADIRKISSIRAYNEAKGVLQRNRREILLYLNALKTEFSRPGHPIINAESLFLFSEGYFASITNEKTSNALSRFANKNIFDITTAVQDGNAGFEEYKRTIGAAFQAALDSLDVDCRPHDGAFIRRYDICPQIYDQTYITEQYRLMTRINYLNDVQILLDSYFIKDRVLPGSLFFVTTDGTHILNNKDDIELILTGISVTHPREHFRAN